MHRKTLCSIPEKLCRNLFYGLPLLRSEKKCTARNVVVDNGTIIQANTSPIFLAVWIVALKVPDQSDLAIIISRMNSINYCRPERGHCQNEIHFSVPSTAASVLQVQDRCYHSLPQLSAFICFSDSGFCSNVYVRCTSYHFSFLEVLFPQILSRTV